MMASAADSVARRFEQEGIDFALIGGIALVLHGVDRTTKDIDFIIERAAAERADELLLSMGFERLSRNEVFGNYLLEPLRVDLLYTRGEHSKRMLEQAQRVRVRNASRKVVGPEDLIGLKLQALANNPTRLQDWADVQSLLCQRADTMDLALVREYFILFERESDLDELLDSIRATSS